jgi:U3 small nucleolar RNA-associated protein 10
MTPYLSFLLSPFIELLRGSDDQDEDPCGPARLCIVQTLTKSMAVDEGGPSIRHTHTHTLSLTLTPSGTSIQKWHFTPIFSFHHIAFWRDDRLQQVTPVLIALVAPAGAEQDGSPAPPLGGGSSGRDIVSAGLVALCDVVTDDMLLKRINLDVLMHTRADEARVRIFALRCARALWTAHGSKLIGALWRRG